jgi:hypothetical protein
VSIFRKSPDVVARHIAGEHLLVPVRRGVAHMDYLYLADEVGSFVFSLLDGRRDVPALAREVSRAFEVDPGRAESDVAAFLADLHGEGLVETAPETAIPSGGERP